MAINRNMTAEVLIKYVFGVPSVTVPHGQMWIVFVILYVHVASENVCPMPKSI